MARANAAEQARQRVLEVLARVSVAQQLDTLLPDVPLLRNTWRDLSAGERRIIEDYRDALEQARRKMIVRMTS